MALPFEPEPMKNLKERFSLAIREANNATKIVHGGTQRPGEKRQHVFDLGNGLRIVASRDYEKDFEAIHFSASVGNIPEEDLPPTAEDLLRMMEDSICELSGYSVLEYIGLHGQKEIPHWIIKLSNRN